MCLIPNQLNLTFTFAPLLHTWAPDGPSENEGKRIFTIGLEILSSGVCRAIRDVRTVCNVMRCLCYCFVSCFMCVCSGG